MEKVFETYIEFVVNEWRTSDNKIWSFKLKDGSMLDVIKVDMESGKSKETLINFKVNGRPVKYEEVKNLLKQIHAKKIENLLDLIELEAA